jgi:hypothetical protein
VIPEPAPVAVAAPVIEPSPAPTTAPIHVETRPAGAVITVEGPEDVSGCESTPCTIEAPIGQHIVLRATRGRSTGSTELTPEGASTVQIALLAASRRPHTQPHAGTKGGEPATKSGSNDLKIPDIFR